MNKLFKISILLLSLSLFLSCGGEKPNNGDEPEKPDNNELPTPPAEINTSNTFLVDFFSTLEDEGNFFQKRDIAVASQHIQEQSGKIPLVFMFDRSDFTVGQSHPLNKMSYDIAINQFFAQQEATTTTIIKGTGIATKYPISKYDGIAENGAYISGCVIPAPLKKPTQICIYTSRINTLDQIKEIYKTKSLTLLGDAVIIGTVDNTIKADVVNYIEKTMSLRAKKFNSEGSKLDILVIVPAAYVCRTIESGTKFNLPYYRITIEKWM